MLGLGISWISILVNGAAWRLLLHWLGHPQRAGCDSVVRAKQSAQVPPRRHLHLVERLRVLRSQIGAGPALAAVILDPLLIAAASVLMIVVGGWQNGLLVVAPLPALLMVPRWREPILQRLERIKARQFESKGEGSLEIENYGSGRAGYPWMPMAWQLAFVACRFLGFYCCVLAFKLPDPAWFIWLASFSMAYAVGLVVPGAPGGLGVFEATLLLRLGSSVAEAPLLAVVLSYRVISTLADLLAGGALVVDGALLRRFSPRPQGLS